MSSAARLTSCIHGGFSLPPESILLHDHSNTPALPSHTLQGVFDGALTKMRVFICPSDRDLVGSSLSGVLEAAPEWANRGSIAADPRVAIMLDSMLVVIASLGAGALCTGGSPIPRK